MGEVKASIEKGRATMVELEEILHVGSRTEKQRKEESQTKNDEK